MTFDLFFSTKARKYLKKCGPSAREILDKIELLKETPIIHDSKPVKGFREKLYRIRFGEIRILLHSL